MTASLTTTLNLHLDTDEQLLLEGCLEKMIQHMDRHAQGKTNLDSDVSRILIYKTLFEQTMPKGTN